MERFYPRYVRPRGYKCAYSTQSQPAGAESRCRSPLPLANSSKFCVSPDKNAAHANNPCVVKPRVSNNLGT